MSCILYMWVIDVYFELLLLLLEDKPGSLSNKPRRYASNPTYPSAPAATRAASAVTNPFPNDPPEEEDFFELKVPVRLSAAIRLHRLSPTYLAGRRRFEFLINSVQTLLTLSLPTEEKMRSTPWDLANRRALATAGVFNAAGESTFLHRGNENT
jgi:hypothetical protein